MEFWQPPNHGFRLVYCRIGICGETACLTAEMRMTPLSVIVITRNEERNIAACLESVTWADDIVIVDAQSGDATVALARRFTQKIFVEPWKSFSEAKEFAVSKSRHDWVLWLDADERVTPELASEIQSLLASSPT